MLRVFASGIRRHTQAAKENVEARRQKHADEHEKAQSQLTLSSFNDPKKVSSSTSLFQATAYLGFYSSTGSQASALGAKEGADSAHPQEDAESASEDQQAEAAPVVKVE